MVTIYSFAILDIICENTNNGTKDDKGMNQTGKTMRFSVNAVQA